jgi:hypothetical protein
MQWVQTTDVLRIEPSLGWFIERLAASYQLSSTNRRHPLAQQSEIMLEAWSARTLQACHTAGVVELVVVPVSVACLP